MNITAFVTQYNLTSYISALTGIRRHSNPKRDNFLEVAEQESFHKFVLLATEEFAIHLDIE